MCSVVYFYPVNYVACCVVFTYLDTMHSAFCIESIIMAGCLTDLKTYVKKTEYRHSSEPSIWYQCYLTLQGTTKCSTLSNRNTYQRKAYALSFWFLINVQMTAYKDWSSYELSTGATYLMEVRRVEVPIWVQIQCACSPQKSKNSSLTLSLSLVECIKSI